MSDREGVMTMWAESLPRDDGLQYTTFQIIPYLERFPDHILVTSLMDITKLEDVQLRSEDFPLTDDPFEDAVFDE